VSLSAILTILTVALEKHYPYIRRQLELATQLNPGVPFKLIVVDNSGAGEPGLVLEDPRCSVRAGVARDDNLSTDYRGSYHHAAALNSALGEVDTRFLLVLDPDLFPVYRNWISDCIEHMTRRGLSVFGVPWYYRWYRKYRYYPCVHFMLIDLQRIDRSELDFTPALKQDHERESSALHGFFRRLAPTLYARFLIATRRDTGWRIHHRFAHRVGHRHGVAQPVIDVSAEIVKPKHLASADGQRRERLTPRRWSFLPAPGEYLEPGGAPGFEHTSFGQLAPEKFVWRGSPFAFHLRGNVRDVMNGEFGRDIEAEALEGLFGRLARSPSWTEWAREEAQA
jgi:hypothetical protein